MQKSKIEWTDYTINPVKGMCPHACSYCYGRAMYKRFKWNPNIRYIEPGFIIADLRTIKKPSRIFWGSTMELFGDWISDLWLKDIFKIICQFPQHKHILLTKQSQNLAKFSPFPENCWVGVSCENEFDLFRHASNLGNIEASIRFISFEPLLRWRGLDKLVEVLKDVARVQWVIIGGVTKHPELPQPQISWVKDIVTACDHAGVKVFLKNSLYWLLEDTIPNPLFWKRDVISNILRQEMPESKR